MQDHPLDASDFEFIEDTLLKYGDDHSVLNASELDGYFTALVSSPVQVDIAEWFPAIWGGQNPDWQSPDEGKRFIELSVRHINALATQLAMHAQAFKPRFEQTEHHGQPLTLAEEWCFGYLRGVGVGNWPELPTPLAAQLQAIAFCAEQDNFEPPADLDVAQHCQQIAAIETAAHALHDHWVAQR
ncbi:uncharacterized protein FBY03_101414 [Pseudomonas sp. SJZ079]|uniref:UPF0149 family protein n=1 Tax=Pseudomonas sp. SJZ079 TaxID=2572887 RepID=UPI00119B2BF8|nr:UPF0149 family protein [Pseudomonas sp. SJZ079]TWC43218.1 uncharacterized protein FBY03_101414 [Pseudomonas sp. SJZ079]